MAAVARAEPVAEFGASDNAARLYGGWDAIRRLRAVHDGGVLDDEPVRLVLTNRRSPSCRLS